MHLRKALIMGALFLIFSLPLGSMNISNSSGDRKELETHEEFLEAIGKQESENDYTAVNPYGHLGRYQFNMVTLGDIGIHTDEDTFLETPSMQEKAMRALLRRNRKILESVIQAYEGTLIEGIQITESGILAAAHLAGAGGVKKFFNEGRDLQDKNGASISYYLTQFSGYSLDL